MAVKLFLAAGMNVNATYDQIINSCGINNKTALGAAIDSNRTEVIKLLFDNGASPNASCGEPFLEVLSQIFIKAKPHLSADAIILLTP